MEQVWIPITVAAALCQSVRTALQKALAGKVSTNASAFVRFAYGAPFALVYLLALAFAMGVAPPAPSGRFLLCVVAGSVAQIVATSLLIHVLGKRNFPVGVAYSKTEVIQAAVFGLVFLDDRLTLWGAAAILTGTLGVMLFSIARGPVGAAALVSAWTSRTALLGILSGACFGLSAVGFRGASLAAGLESPFLSAAYALAWSTVLQSLMMAAWLQVREREQWAKLARVWKPSALAGIASVLGSAGWFTAMTLVPVAYVRTLGLVELLFTFALSVFWFRERPRRREAVGVVLLVCGIAMVLNPS